MPPPTPNKTAADKNELTNKILHEIYGLYTNPASVDRSAKFGTSGLENISKEARMPTALLHPRRRVTVMVVGNHSAGKVSRRTASIASEHPFVSVLAAI